MVQSQLNAYSGSDPIWGFVAVVRSERFTGEAAVGLDPRVRLFAVDGHIYFAEREDDAPVGTRLVNCGAISTLQLARGVVQAGGHESLARLFQRDATIDRDAVELTIASSTETLLATIANNPVGMPEVFPLRHHATGIHHWLRPTPPAVEEPAVEEPVEDVVANEPVVVHEVVAEPVVVHEVVAEPVVVHEVVAEPVVAEAVEPGIPEPITPEPLTVPMLATFPAPREPVRLAIPEWPRADDEPGWEIPAVAVQESVDVPQIAALVPMQIAAPVVEEVVPQIVAPMDIDEPEVVELEVLNELVTAEVVTPQVAVPEVTPSAGGMPKLAALHSISNFAPSPEQVAKNEPSPNGVSSEVDGSPLPKLATGPVSMKDLKVAAAASESWGNTSNNMAAVEIWEMVDDLFEDPKEEIQVGGGPQEQSRGWKRKKS